MVFFRALTASILIAFLAVSVIATPSPLVTPEGCLDSQISGELSEVEQALCQSYTSRQAKRGKATTSVYASASIFINLMQSCNDRAVSLGAILNGLLGITANLFVGRVVPTLNLLVLQIQASINTITNVTACTDAQLAASVYASFQAFVHAQIKLYEFICAHASLWATLNLKVSLHAALVQLQVVLEAYVTLLFQYISADLDLSANLRVLLSASLQRAIDACAS
ncbi:secreted protein [Phakopsora pachyrhizi]|uniref:Secreted protein n=2 Tax=Phakopsora pachyrhizi TaxID=170000 RepID=A0AAV0B2A5_PHAPC|nr:secreted protein [Phakopsora pachyrhizi]